MGPAGSPKRWNKSYSGHSLVGTSDEQTMRTGQATNEVSCSHLASTPLRVQSVFWPLIYMYIHTVHCVAQLTSG